VGHGEREAIGVFEVDTSKAKPEVVWVGCVLTPESLAANSVMPMSMQVSSMAESLAQTAFSNATMVLEVNDELWFGTFNGDRIAYITLGR